VRLDPERQLRLELLYADYAAALDDGPLEDWPRLFGDPCLYRVMPRDNFDADLPLAIMRCESRGMLEDRVRAVRETIMHEPRYLRHQITNVRGRETETGRIAANANYVVVEVLADALPRILSVGRYIDVVEIDLDGVWRFVDKLVVYDSVLVPNTIVYPL
jgi:salicylate 5-hydroxylase small subunit